MAKPLNTAHTHQPKKPRWRVMFSKRGGLARYFCLAHTATEAQNRVVCAMGEAYLYILTVEKIK